MGSLIEENILPFEVRLGELGDIKYLHRIYDSFYSDPKHPTSQNPVG